MIVGKKTNGVTVIKNGDLELYKQKKLKVKRFECTHCTCIFDATDEYYKSEQYYGAYAKCPCCGETVWDS